MMVMLRMIQCQRENCEDGEAKPVLKGVKCTITYNYDGIAYHR